MDTSPLEQKISYNCICCSKEIRKIDGMPNDKPWEGMWNDGVVERIAAGYGSLLDGDIFVISICDTCLDKKTIEGTALWIGNYMFNGVTRYIGLKEQSEK